jgi:enterochelin esterase-like enzyme
MLAQFEIASELLDKPRKIRVQHAPVEQVADCLIFLDAEFYVERVQAPTIVANLQNAGNLPPVTSIYVSHVDQMARTGDCTCNPDFASFVATDLRRWIERTVARFDRFFLCGLSLSGLAATFAALQHPTAFCGVLARSPSAWCREVHHQEFSGGHDMACWAQELPRALPWLMRETPG